MEGEPVNTDSLKHLLTKELSNVPHAEVEELISTMTYHETCLGIFSDKMSVSSEVRCSTVRRSKSRVATQSLTVRVESEVVQRLGDNPSYRHRLKIDRLTTQAWFTRRQFLELCVG